jgi:hypothetical protein
MPCFEKMKIDLFDLHDVCVYVCKSPPIHFGKPELIFMKCCMYGCIMAPEPILTAYLKNPSRQSVCLYVYLLYSY